MPLLKKTSYNLSPKPHDLKASEELFVISETKECFRSYDEYIAKVFLYSSQRWSCQYTGKSGLTYNAALLSEQEALNQLQSFPDCFKEPILKAIHEGEGSLKDVAEECSKLLASHYYVGEKVAVLNPRKRKKTLAVITEVLNASKQQNKKVDNVVKDKENEAVLLGSKLVFSWKYSVQLEGTDVVLTDIPQDEIKRMTKLPTKQLLKMFIKSSCKKISVNGKDMWFVKDDLIQKYNLSPIVSKEESKNPLRSPLNTISGKKTGNFSKQKTKRTSPIDPTQRTLNFFVKTPKSTITTPSKQTDERERKKGSPVEAKLQICLTPENKLQDVLPVKSSGKSEVNSPRNKDKEKNMALRTLFTGSAEQEKKAVMEMHEVIELDNDFYEKEKKLVEKNALNKQKTLSQMFKLNTSNKPSNTEDRPKEKKIVKLVSQTSVESKTDSVDLNCGEKTSHKNGLEFVQTPLRRPKPVEIPEQLRKHFGDILMITEFIHCYRNFFDGSRNIRCSSDDLMSNLMSDDVSKSKVFLHILISFLHVLLTDLQQQDSSIEFSDLCFDLLDMKVSEATVGELTRLYLQHEEQLNVEKNTNKNVLMSRKLSQQIFLDLNKKDIFDLTAVRKLEVLVFLLERILVSELFYSHYQELDQNRRQAWVKKIELETEIKEILQEQKKQDELKNAQKEIDTFLEKSKGVDLGSDKESNDVILDSENTKDCRKENIPENRENNEKVDRKKGFVKTIGGLTKRQEVIVQNRIEKEKLDERQRIDGELYEKRQKIEQLKEVISQVRDCRRVEPLGSDREHNRYWLFQSHSRGLLVEKMTWTGLGDGVIQQFEEGDILLSEQEWHYYTTPEEINNLISALSYCDKDENALKQRLKSLKSNEKLNFSKRETSVTDSRSVENDTDCFENLKKEMCDLACRMAEKEMGIFENLNSWCENVTLQSSIPSLASLATEFGSAINIRCLCKQLGDRERWLGEVWVPATSECVTSSRLRFCIALFDHCITWDACTLYKKCKICRRSAGAMAVCDECRTGFHIGCLRPALNEVPDEEWLCPGCRPAEEQNTRRGETKKHEETIEVETAEVHYNDDYCDVCGGEGELVCCDSCPKVYHKECHDPPLRNIPRGVWKCCSCQGRRPTAKKRNIPAETDLFSDLESSQDESASDDSSYLSGSESCSEYSVEDSAVDERTERAKRREETRKENEADAERSSKKRKTGKKKAKQSTTGGNKEQCGEKKRRVTIRDFLNEDSSEENEEDVSGIKEFSTLKKSVSVRVKSDQRNETNSSRVMRKRKGSPTLQENLVTSKRKPRLNSEMKICEALLKDLMLHEDSWPFIEAVDVSEVPDYFEIIKYPMDFSTIKRKLNTLEYSGSEEFINDVRLVFANSDQYNLETSDHGLAGISLQAYFEDIVPNYLPKFEREKPRRQQQQKQEKVSSKRTLRKRRC